MENIIKALAAAQAEYPIIGKNREGQNGNQKSKYADLAAIVDAVRPINGKHGLCHTFTISNRDDNSYLETTLFHTSGDKIVSYYPLGELFRLNDKDAGKRITYAKRYSLKALLGVEESEDPSDDGWGNNQTPQSLTPKKTVVAKDRALQQPEVKQLWDQVKKLNITADELSEICAILYKVDNPRKLTLSQASSLMEKIKAKGRDLVTELAEGLTKG